MRNDPFCPYDKRALHRYLLFLVLVFGVTKFSGGTGFILYAPFLLTAAVHRRSVDLAYWIMLGVASLSAGSFFVPRNGTYALVQRGSFMLLGFIGLVDFLGRKKSPLVAALMGMIPFLLYMIIPSCDGWWPKVSLLKLLFFGTVYCSYVEMANTSVQDNRLDIRKLRSAYLSIAIFFVLGSVVSMATPGISYMNGKELLDNPHATSLFKGTTNHSQWLGPLACGYGLLILGDWLWSIQRWNRLYAVLFFCCPLLIFKTSCRTAMGTFVVGLAFLLFNFFQAHHVRGSWRSKVISTAVVLVALSGLAIVLTPSGREGFSRFVVKRGAETKMGEIKLDRVISSRKGLIDVCMENFRLKPAIGNGFQVCREMAYMARHGDGMVLSAPVEKGVWVAALLEEGGVLGMLIYCLFIGSALMIMLSKKAYVAATVFFAMHISNLGEFTMFSMSGCGGMWWMQVFLGLILDTKRNQQIRVAPLPNNYNSVAWRG